VQVSNLLVVLNEMNGLYRQVFMDVVPCRRISRRGRVFGGPGKATRSSSTASVSRRPVADWHGNVLTEQAGCAGDHAARLRSPDVATVTILGLHQALDDQAAQVIATDSRLVTRSPENEQSSQRMR
jgi:hypothetical protein